MKSNTTWQRVRVVLSFCFIFSLSSSFAQQISWTGVPCSGLGCPSSGQHDNSFEFSITGLPLPEGDYSYLWNFGDGTFKTIPAGVGATVQHTYTQTGVYTPIVELTQEDYEDDPPPASSFIITDYVSGSNLTVNNLSTSLYLPPVNTMGANELFRITPSRGPVVTEGQGDLVSYAFQYQDPCDENLGGASTLQLKFFYPHDLVEADNRSDFTGINGITQSNIPGGSFHWMGLNGETFINGVVNSSTGQMELTFEVPASNVKFGPSYTLFLYFKIKDNIPTNSPYTLIGEYIPLGVPLSRACPAGNPQGPITTTIANSHDPNIQITDPSLLLCPGPTTGSQTVEYTVEFQNDGAAMTKQVDVKVWVDAQLDPIGVTIIGSSSNVTIANYTTNTTDQYIEFTLKPASLEGTNDPDYLSAFFEDATIGFIQFEVPVKNNVTLEGCSGLFSRSEIIFDCNSPILTNVVITPIGCPDTVNVGNCEKCLESPLFSLAPANYSANVDLATASQIDAAITAAGMDPSNCSYKWFPQEGLTNTNQKVARFTNAIYHSMDAYYLMVGEVNTCQNFVMKVPINWPVCDLGVNIVPICQNGQPTSLMIQVNDGTPIYYGMECDATTKTCCLPINTMNNPSSASLVIPIPNQPTLNYIVKDAAGCYASTTIDLPFNPLMVEDDPGDCEAELIITGGTPPYTAEWFNASLGTAPNQSVDLNNNTNFGPVTITDANGCSYTLDLQRNSCGGGGIISWPWGVIGIGVVLVATLIIGIRLERR